MSLIQINPIASSIRTSVMIHISLVAVYQERESVILLLVKPPINYSMWRRVWSRLG